MFGLTTKKFTAMEKILHIYPGDCQAEGGAWEIRGRLDLPDLGSMVVHVRVEHLEGFVPPESLDWLALAALFPAMQHAERLHIHGAVDKLLLANLAELNSIWHVWRPERYKLIEIEAESVLEGPVQSCRRGRGHLLAFSGGVDACAALLRHRQGQLGWRTRSIASAVLIHGFDVPLSDDVGFSHAVKSAQLITESVGTSLARVRCNFRELPIHWEDSFGCMVAAALHAIGRGYEGGVFASASDHYAAPPVRWGSSPVSDVFLNSSDFGMYVDGCELSRLDKVRILGTSRVASEHVRVCWEGSKKGLNCGKCEKCIRTQLEFALCDGVGGARFERPMEPGDVVGVRIRNPHQKLSYDEVLKVAKKEGRNDWWVGELRQLMRRTNAALLKQDAAACVKRLIGRAG